MDGDIARISLSNDKSATIDAEDVDLVLGYYWNAIPSTKDSFYAIGHLPGSNKFISMSRLILGITEIEIKVDHINKDTLDNRKTNLRRATTSQNGMNRAKMSNSRNRYKGVQYDKDKKKWRAIIRFNGKCIRSKRLKTELEAAREYDRLALLHHGAFASPNFQSSAM